MKFIKRPAWQYPWMFLQGFGALADGLVMILSLGTCVSSYSLKICSIRTSKHIEKEIKAKKNKGTPIQ